MIDCVVGFYEECESMALMLISLYPEVTKYGGMIWIVSDNTRSEKGLLFLESIQQLGLNVNVSYAFLKGDIRKGRDSLAFEWALKNLPLTNPFILFCHSDIELERPLEMKKALDICQQNEDIIGSVILDSGGWVKYNNSNDKPILFSPRIAPWFSLFKRETWFLNRLSWANNEGSIFKNNTLTIEDTGANLFSSFLKKNPPGRLFYFTPDVVFHWRAMSANLKRIDLNLVPDSLLGNQSVESYKKDFLTKLNNIRYKLSYLSVIPSEFKLIVRDILRNGGITN